MKTTVRKPIQTPAELRRSQPGSYSVHYYGEEAGAVVEWDGRSADDLLSDDIDEALLAGAADDNGDLPRMEVIVVDIDESGDCALIDQAHEG